MASLFDLDSWQEIGESLRRNKLRVVLTAFGVFWGIFMLVMMLGMGAGLQNGVMESMGGQITQSMFIWSRSTSMPYQGMKPGRSVEITNRDVEAIRRQVPGVGRLSRRIQLGGYRGSRQVSRGAYSGTFSINGDEPQIRDINSIEMLEGRFINPFDLEEHRKVAVIGEYVREVLFPEGGSPLGQSIEVNNVYFTVVGVFGVDEGGDSGRRQAQTVHVPFTTAQRAFNFGDKVGWLAASSQADVSAVTLEKRIKRFLKQRKSVHPDDPSAFGSYNAQEEYEKLQNLFTGIRALVWVVGVGTLLAGIVGVGNIMLISVRERTREFGLRKALGAPPGAIVRMVVLEALLLTLLAGYLGLLSGVGLLEWIGARLAENGGGGRGISLSDPGVNWRAALTALLILVGAGLLAGWFPARKAARVEPVVALRSE